MQEIRVTYPGEALFVDGTRIIRAQTFGATGTLNSEDINELGNNEIVEAVDDAPNVAIDVTTYDYVSLTTEALLAGENPSKVRFLGIPNFTKDVGTSIWAPIIQNIDYGKTNAEAGLATANPRHLKIYRTMYIENAFVNNIDLTYSTDGIAENAFSLESDNKRWFFNDGASVVDAVAANALSATVTNPIPTVRRFKVFGGGVSSAFTAASGVATTDTPAMTALNDGGFTLGKNLDGETRITVTQVDKYIVETELIFDGTVPNGNPDSIVPASGKFLVELDSAANVNTGRFDGIAILTNETQMAAQAAANGDFVQIRYTAKDYGAYFAPDPSEIGGARRGNVLIYLAPTIIDSFGRKKIDRTREDVFFRMQTASITVDLTREQLNEIGHFRPYSRTVTLPVNVTVSLEAIDADPLIISKLSEKRFLPDSNNITDTELSITDLSKDLNIILKLFRYNDEDRRLVYTALKNAYPNNTDAVAGFVVKNAGFDEELSQLPAYGGDGVDYQTSVPGLGNVYTHDLAPSKYVVVKQLIPTDEAQTLSVGSNATQTFSFRGNTSYYSGIGGGNNVVLGSDNLNSGFAVDSSEIAGVAFDGGQNATFREYNITVTDATINADYLYVTASGVNKAYGLAATAAPIDGITKVNVTAGATVSATATNIVAIINADGTVNQKIIAAANVSGPGVINIKQRLAGDLGDWGLHVDAGPSAAGARTDYGAPSLADPGIDAGTGTKVERRIEVLDTVGPTTVDLLSITANGITSTFGDTTLTPDVVVTTTATDGPVEIANLFSASINANSFAEFGYTLIAVTIYDPVAGDTFIHIRNSTTGTTPALAVVSTPGGTDFTATSTSIDAGTNATFGTATWQAFKYGVISSGDSADI